MDNNMDFKDPNHMLNYHVRYDDGWCVVLWYDRQRRFIQDAMIGDKESRKISVDRAKILGYIPVIVQTRAEFEARISEDRKRYAQAHGDTPYILAKREPAKPTRLEKGIFNTLLILECIGIITVTLFVVVPLFLLAFAL